MSVRTIEFSTWFSETNTCIQNTTISAILVVCRLLGERAEAIRKWRILTAVVKLWCCYFLFSDRCTPWSNWYFHTIMVPMSCQRNIPHTNGFKTSAWCRDAKETGKIYCGLRALVQACGRNVTQQPASTLAEIILIKKPTSNEHAYIRRSGVAVEQRLDSSFYCDNTHYRISDRRRSFVDVVSFVGVFREIMQTHTITWRYLPLACNFTNENLYETRYNLEALAISLGRVCKYTRVV